jgi:hypothetical protein
MKRVFPLVAALFVAALVLSLSACPSPVGLHNQPASKLTVIIKNFATPDGNYALPGGAKGGAWAANLQNNNDVVLKNGAGSSNVLTVTATSYVFTLVPTGSWARPWYPATKGNAWDGNNQQNFLLEGIPQGLDISVTIDGATVPATITPSF